MKTPKLTYSLIDEMMASATDPMPSAMREYQQGEIKSALDNMRTSSEPSKDDWRLLSDAVNLMETLVTDMNVASDPEGLLEEAVLSMKHAAERSMRGFPIRLDGIGLTAVTAIVNGYLAALNEYPHRTMVRCHRKTERRIAAIRANIKRSHDVVVTQI